MRSREATNFGKALYRTIIKHQPETEILGKEVFLCNVQNMEKEITDEEAQKRLSTHLIKYSQTVSQSFAIREKEMSQVVVPYLMLEMVSNPNNQNEADPMNNLEEPTEVSINQSNVSSVSVDQPNIVNESNDFFQRFRENLERLKPKIIALISQHWKPVVGGIAFGTIAFAVARTLLGLAPKQALFAGGGLGFVVLFAWEAYNILKD